MTITTGRGRAPSLQIQNKKQKAELCERRCGSFTTAKPFVVEMALNEARVQDGQAQFRIGYTVDNTPFVTVDRDILQGKPQQEWVKVVKDNLRKRFPNGVTVGNNEIKINQNSQREMTYSRYMLWLLKKGDQIYGDKLRATDNADEILRASRNYINEALLHPRKDDIIDFARGNVFIRVGSNDYSAEVIVGKRKNGKMLLYDIINFKPTRIIEKNKKIRRRVKPSFLIKRQPTEPLYLTKTTYHKVGMLSIDSICKVRGIIHRVYWIEMRKGSGHRWRGMESCCLERGWV